MDATHQNLYDETLPDDCMYEESSSASTPDAAEEEQDLTTIALGAPTMGPPPPHLAARFYRNRANSRRKSSAASSRRNSFSSAQSHTSSRSHRRSSGVGIGCQSNYIAQHLRRNSIIESRRARLADRAAHAEQVRLRAALVKAAPRGSISISEERALAAQLAKEKYLAKVTAACAEEVARAKRVAEEVKERKQAEEARQRLEMEERHAEAERRRAEYQRNLQARRTRRSDSTGKKLAVVEELGDNADEEAVEIEPVPLDDITASRRIQRAWRSLKRKAAINAFNKLAIHTKRAENTDFEEMTSLIADAEVITTTTTILTLLGLQDSHDDIAALNTRTFLSAYLILGNPVAVLNNQNGTQEQDLILKASDLLQQFQTTIVRLAPWNSFIPNAMQLESLSQAYTSYTSAFAAWRLQDSSILIEGMVATFVELDAIWQTVKDDTLGEVANDYREGIRDNQVMLLSRIRKLAGPDRADMLIKKAIRENRRKRPKQPNAAEVRPRAAEPSALSVEVSVAERPLDDHTSTPTDLQSELPSSDFIRKLFTLMPSNRVLTHELAIDNGYRLVDTSAALREDLNRSVCETMKHGFQNGSGSLWTISTAENVRAKLLRMLKPGNSMYQVVSNALDLGQVARQCKAGVFSYEGFFEFMANILPKLCAPFRDAEIAGICQALQAPTDAGSIDSMIDKLLKLFRAVDMLNLDYSNFLLRNAAPTLIREAAGYEARQFEADMAATEGGRPKTMLDCWAVAENDFKLESERRNPEGHLASRPRMETIYVKMLLDLAIAQGPLDLSHLPETLTLDRERLATIRQQSVRITVIGAVLLTAKNLLKRDVRGPWKNEAGRLWQLLTSEGYGSDQRTDSEVTPAQKAFSILETAHNMPPVTKSQLSSMITRFFGQAATATTTRTHFSDPVLKVLFQRLRTHVSSRLSAATAVEKVRATSSASEKLTSFGLGEMSVQVGSIVATLERVRTVDLQAHGEWYNTAYRDDEADEMSEAPAIANA